MKLILSILLSLFGMGTMAQTVEQELKANVNRAAGMFYARPIVGIHLPQRVRNPFTSITMVVRDPIISTRKSITKRLTPFF